MPTQTLFNELTPLLRRYKTPISGDILNNLNQTKALRPYQQKAILSMQFYFEDEEYSTKPNKHLLFQMATGSGKTLIMASSILHLYTLGYRNFLFFVNSTNIIQKTIDNFTNVSSDKYLFNSQIQIDGSNVNVNVVTNFGVESSDNGINICFTTIQGLHTSLSQPKENSLTFEDFEAQKIVLISDEAHHINSDTKKGTVTQDELIETATWESTINKIHKSNSQNVLLEYTATADLSNEFIAAKYADKLIFDYPLKEFRADGYSKDVKVLQFDGETMDRALQAVILSQYRLKLFAKNGLNIKPVVLFKSKTIKDSQQFFEDFITRVEELIAKDLNLLQSKSTEVAIQSAFSFFVDNNITVDNLVLEIKNGFAREKLIEVNSKDESEAKQLAVNTLESVNNEYRAVFAVDKLNEGWDVLNLFDIVRLYDTRDSKGNKAGKTTVSEAQLIGRGARYCPFIINSDDSRYQRKYDQDDTNELKICEELYYYSSYNPKYIQELTAELKKQGIIAETHKQVKLELKESFKQSSLYQNGLIWLNRQKPRDLNDITNTDNLLDTKNYIYKAILETNTSTSSNIFEESKVQNTTFVTQNIACKLNQIPQNALTKALQKSSFFSFENIKKILPQVKSVKDLLSSDNWLCNINIEIRTTKKTIGEITNQEWLTISLQVLNQISDKLKSQETKYKGTVEFYPENIKHRLKPEGQLLNLAIEQGEKQVGVPQTNNTNQGFSLDINAQDWYAHTENYGTDQEKYLVKCIAGYMEKLQVKYEQVYLLRNEKIYKIYNFDDGMAFQPDFILFLETNSGEQKFYQVFIEPKGEHLFENDKWKEDCLKSLRSKVKLETLLANDKYNILGMPFYNETKSKVLFEENFKTSLGY
jgi:type III restriction enzyme